MFLKERMLSLLPLLNPLAQVLNMVFEFFSELQISDGRFICPYPTVLVHKTDAWRTPSVELHASSLAHIKLTHATTIREPV